MKTLPEGRVLLRGDQLDPLASTSACLSLCFSKLQLFRELAGELREIATTGMLGPKRPPIASLTRMGKADEITKATRDCTEIFLALGDHRRQDILLLLETQGPMNVLEITKNIGLSRPTISHHLRVLKAAGLVTVERKSKENFYFTNWGEGRVKLLEFMHRVLNA